MAPATTPLIAAVLLSLSLSLSCAVAQHVAVPPSAPRAAAAAPGPAPGMSAACLNSLLNMSDCLPYVQAGSTAGAPEKPCCPELATMVGSNPVCLCQLLSGGADSYGIAVDIPRALALPGVCRVATPPLSTCEAMGYHVRLGPSPAPAPGSLSPGVSPSGGTPQFPAGPSPSASPPASPKPSHGARRFHSAGVLVVVLAASFAALLTMF